MKHLKMDRKGQFSIIAALFVVVILVSSVMVTYSMVRFSSNQNQPQIISAIDETNLALKQVLGFTVGYYGSILQVTGNSTYAYDQSETYLNSGLNNIVDVNPDWGTSFTNTALSLGTNWFTNESYSQGQLNVTYSLTGLGVSGVAYSISSALNVDILKSTLSNQVSLTVTQNGDTPLVALGTSNFKFYLYQYGNLSWAMVNPPAPPAVSGNGTYTIQIPAGINPQSFIIQVQDSRGIMVSASSFSHYTGTLTFNGTTVGGGSYINQDDSQVDGLADQGTHSNFQNQQQAPKGVYDTLTEADVSTTPETYHPASYILDGSTTLVSGSPSNLVSDDGNYMIFGSYQSATSSQTLYSCQSTKSISGTSYYTYLTSSASNSGTTLPASMSSSSTLLGKAVYSLQGITSIPASTWTLDYRACETVGSTTITEGNAGSAKTTSGSTVQFSYQAGSGSNAMLIVGVSINSNSVYVKSITYGSGSTKSLTLLQRESSESGVSSELWALVAPASGSSGYQITVTLSANANAVAGAATFFGVVQNLPSASAYTQNYGSSSSPSQSLTVNTPNSYLVGNLATAACQIKSEGSGQTQLWDQQPTGLDGHGSVEANVGSGPQSMSWTLKTSGNWAMEIVALTPLQATGNMGVNILIRESNGAQRGSNLATDVAASGSLTDSYYTLSGTYSFPGYTVVSQTDYLEIDYYVYSSTTYSTSTANLIIDDSALPQAQQTQIQNVQLPSQYTCEAELSGTSNLNNWNNLAWEIDADSTVGSTPVVLQLYNYAAGQYPTSGSGYFTATLGTTIAPNSQTITSNPTQSRDNIGDWKMRFTATASTPFNINVDMASFTSGVADYGLNLEEQWTNLNMTALPNPALCVYGGTMGSSNLAIDVWYHNSWQSILTGLTSGWNNMSINSYLTSGSTTLAIKFSSTGDTIQNSYNVASTLLRPESNLQLFTSMKNPAATVAVELLQNGTMVWLGQNLQVTTQTIPVPPVPVKSIHVNETINGVNQQVPFQIEDWASFYTVPLGLTNNATVFGNRQMVVFLVNTHVSAFTLWWNGSSQAVQTSLAYTDNYFKEDNPSGSSLSNGALNLQFSGSFAVTSTVVDSGTSSTASFMQINNQGSSYGSGVDWVIYNGVVRDIVQQEAEWSGGVNNCPNLYADIVLTLPANATYYTYQLSLMFISSTQTRTISNLCPISLTYTGGQLQTENGTAQGDPVVASGTQLFSSSQTWVHHWSQFTNGNSGAGLMFTDQANHMLYAFDSMAPATQRGALSANSASQTISLLPVTLNSVTFQNALDITWSGAVVTFDSSVPPIYVGNGQAGLWMLAEMPPYIAVTEGN